MSAILEKFDSWLRADGPVAIVVRTPLEPVQGSDAVLFPPTFAPAEKGAAPGYVIDDTGTGKTAIIDTVGAQANRMEPIFKRQPYAGLVPHAVVKIGERAVNLLDAGHRAADALVRFSSQRDAIAAAFTAIAERGDSSLLAKLAPTSLVFGVWDSRGVGVKIPRLIGATVRAHGVEELTRAAQFFSVFEKEETDSLGQPQETLSELGLSDAPAGRGPGGVLAREVQREAILNLVVLRALAGPDAAGSIALQRYILGLALVVLTAAAELYLREGCLLVPAEGKEAEQKVVLRSGAREDFSVDAAQALEFAQAAAAAFGVGADWEATFESDAVKATVEKKKAKKAKTKES